MWKAFEELIELGWASGTKPRFVCVQSEATDPLYRAWLSGAVDTTAAEAGSTVAVGLNVPGGVGHFRVLEIVRESGGSVVAVPEPTIAEWSDRYSGQGIGPEGAACLAALETLVDAGTIRPGDRVVAVNTCGPGKYDPRYAGNSISYSA
jgi:threonine synthase